jgi:hypothetical protein
VRNLMRSGRVWLGLLVVALFGVVGVGGAAAATTTTIGQTDAAANYACSLDGEYDLATAVASGQGYVVPAGDWTITSWSTFAGTFDGTGGSMSMMVFRPDPASGGYTVLAASPVQTLTAGKLNTFSASVRVKGGDELGFWATGHAACSTETGLPADVSPFEFGPQPAVGTTLIPTVVSGYRANISATLAPVATVPQQLSELIAALNALGPGASLASKVKLVVAFLAATNKPLVCGALGSFVNEISAQAGKKLTTAQAASLTTRANGIRAALGCS